MTLRWDPHFTYGSYTMLWDVDESGSIATKAKDSNTITLLRSTEPCSESFDVTVRSLTYDGTGDQQYHHTLGLCGPDYNWHQCNVRQRGACSINLKSGKFHIEGSDETFSSGVLPDDFVRFQVNREEKTVVVTHSKPDGEHKEHVVAWPQMPALLYLAVAMDNVGSSVQIEDLGGLTKAARS